MLTSFGKEVRKLRIDRGMTLKNLAEGLHVSSAYLSAVETGNKNINRKLVDDVISFMELDFEESDRLREAAEMSVKEVRMNIKDKPEKERTVATLFARQFPDFDDQDLDQLLAILQKRQRRE